MKKKILLVDDKCDFRNLLKIILQQKFEVETASNGLEALALLQQGYFPDIIISDINMPSIDGITLLDQIKASEIFRHIPVIILSSIDESRQKIEALQLGASDYVEKPFNPLELEIRLNHVLVTSQG